MDIWNCRQANLIHPNPTKNPTYLCWCILLCRCTGAAVSHSFQSNMFTERDLSWMHRTYTDRLLLYVLSIIQRRILMYTASTAAAANNLHDATTPHRHVTCDNTTPKGRHRSKKKEQKAAVHRRLANELYQY